MKRDNLQRKLLWLLAGVAGTVLLTGLLGQGGQEEAVGARIPVEPLKLPEPVRVEVLNGCGVPQVAARLMKKARALGLGIDVIHEGNAESFNFLHTVVLDRSGDMNKALQVASALGIPHYAQQIITDSFRLADVSIIIGRDYKRLWLFNENQEKEPSTP